MSEGTENDGAPAPEEKTSCAICGCRTDFLAHAPDLCLNCGDQMQVSDEFRKRIATLIAELRRQIDISTTELMLTFLGNQVHDNTRMIEHCKEKNDSEIAALYETRRTYIHDMIYAVKQNQTKEKDP